MKPSFFRNIALTYSSQIFTIIIQFCYIAITSRYLTPHAFGLYGISLTVAGLLSLLTTSGLALNISRLPENGIHRLKHYLIFSILAGFVGSVIIILSASILANLWRAPDSENFLHALAIQVLLIPIHTLLTTHSRNIFKFKTLALTNSLANLAGMLISGTLIASTRNPVFLVTGITISTGIQVVVLAAINYRDFVHGDWNTFRSTLSFGWKLTLLRIVQYSTGNLSKFVMSNQLPMENLGYWNRAEAVSSIPIQNFQTAFVQAFIPTFRSKIENYKLDPNLAYKVVNGIFIFTTFSMIVGIEMTPYLVTFIFDENWDLLNTLLPLTILASLITFSAVVLSNICEYMGNINSQFRISLIQLSFYAISVLIFFNHLSLILILKIQLIGQILLLFQNFLSFIYLAGLKIQKIFFDILRYMILFGFVVVLQQIEIFESPNNGTRLLRCLIEISLILILFPIRTLKNFFSNLD